MKEMGTPDVCIDTRLNWAKGIRNVPYCICVHLSRNAVRMKIHPTNYTHWLPMYQSPLSKVYRPSMYMKTKQIFNTKVTKKKSHSPVAIWPDSVTHVIRNLLVKPIFVV
ncbi:unnamed protein product [Lepidochelys olivacea]